MKLSVSTHPYRRVRISAAQLASIKAGDEVEIAVDVSEPGYVPVNMAVRARITDLLFTGITDARNLSRLEHDPKVKSAMVGKRKPGRD
jgi:hypothetical protein